MSKTDTRVVTAHVPVSMADKVGLIAERMERSKGWVVKQALADWIAREDEQDRLTQEALANVDAGQFISHQAVLAWADSLDSDRPLSVPY